MDVRCEKCQTEYELDESRLKPGGVTVKCTNCGHMFKIRRRTPTNVGVPALEAPTVPSQVSANIARDIHNEATRQGPAPQRTPPMGMAQRPDSVIGESIHDGGSGPTQTERQWLVRLENGEQKTCRELATLQQWIVAGVATRESLISRSGKTWKRLGDIAELSQYFSIADEARTQRAQKPTPKPAASTVLGIGNQPTQPAQPVVRATTPPMGATAAGGTILPDDEDRPTSSFRQRRTTPPPPPPATPKSVSIPKTPDSGPVAMMQTEVSSPKLKPEQRATGTWASSEIKGTDSMASMPQGPRGGKLGITDNEPAFAGRVRLDPGNESSFQTGKVSRLSADDDDAVLPPQRGSRAGTWIAILALLVIGVGAGAVYMFVFNKKSADQQAAGKQDAGTVAAVTTDASAPIVTSLVDAAPEDALASARNELLAGIEPRMKGVYDALATKEDGPSLAMRARLACGLAQSMQERAGLVADKAESDKLKKDSKQLLIDAAPLAQRALKAAADDPSANLAMADVLRLQGKPAKDVQRYLEAAKTKGAADKELARSIALSDALVLARDAKLDDAQKELVGLDGAGDARVQQELAMVAYAKGKPADAKPFVDQLLAASPDHDVARALQKRLETAVATTDPMPQEGSNSVKTPTPPPHETGGGTPVGGNDYDGLVAKADKMAQSSCSQAMPLYTKALEQKPTGVEALTGLGYCYLDAKQFASAFSKFRSALAVSSRFEPALAGVAETYQQQSNKDQAIEAWQRYLDAYPGSQKALKQLQILGASAKPPAPAKPDAGGDDDTTTTTPQPPPSQPSTSQPQKPQQPADGSAS